MTTSFDFSNNPATQTVIQNSGRVVLAIPTLEAGSAMSVNSIPGGAVQLPFDPSEATVSRAGNDLVFETNSGASVTINDFFGVENGNELPMLIFPNGEEASIADIFADNGLELETAAGDTATDAANGGINEYNDNPGDIIDGVSRLGSLGTIYWAQATEVPEDRLGALLSNQRGGGNPGPGNPGPGNPDPGFPDPGTPDPDPGPGAKPRPGGFFTLNGSVYEDALPFQHIGDTETFVPGQLLFTFTPDDGTVVDGIRLSGFPEGTVIYHGDPTDPDTPFTVVTGPDHVLEFSADDFDNGVYFVPPKDSDADFTLSVEVDIRNEASGLTDTLKDTTDIIVDAVADKPELDGDASASADSSGHLSDTTSSSEKYEDGFNTTENTISAGENGGGARVTVTVSAIFGDYLDGSEEHYMLVETHAHLRLDPNSLPEGYTYVGTIVIDGVEYHQFEVDSSILASGEGSASLDVYFTTTGNTSGDESFNIKVGAYTEEDVRPSGEIDLGNNTAHVVTEDGAGANTSVDVVNSTLKITVGWASEGNNAGKHGSGVYSPEFSGMDDGDGVAAESTHENGAPVRIGLNEGSHEGSAEFITSVELTFSEGRGDFCINGDPVYDGMEISGSGGVTYTISVNSDSGAITISVEGGKVTSLDELDMTFRPSQTGDAQYNDSDIDMSYKVNVSNEAGAKAEYEGKTEIVVDAVADKPVDVGGAGVDYGEGQAAALPGQTVEISVKATFPDDDGSEQHTIFIRVDGNNSSATHGYGEHILSKDRIDEVNDIAGNNVLTQSGDYLELSIPPLSDFGADGTYTYADLGITIKYHGNGTYTVHGVEVTLPDADMLSDGDKSNGELNGNTGNASMPFDVIGWAHEGAKDKGSSAANNEHDKNNNDAFTNGNVNVDIAIVGGGKGNFTLGGGSGFENDLPHNNRPEDTARPTAPENNTDEAKGVDLSITWKFPDSGEVVTEIVIKVPTDRFGNPVGEILYKGQVCTPDENGEVRISVPDANGKNGFANGDITFVPDGSASGKVDLEVSATIKDKNSGDTHTEKVGEIEVDVDAVANRSGEVTGEAAYDGDHSAVATGDPITVTVSTTFSDNDGSEQHYILVQQNPHWNGKYETGYYDLDGDGTKEPYFKVPVPTAPPVGAAPDYPGDAHHLSSDEWNTLCETGTVTRDGMTITLPKDANGNWDPAGEWKVEAEVTLTPPPLGEGTHSLGTGSLVEELNIDHSTENRGNDYKDNNIAMRPGNDVAFEVNNTEGIDVQADFVYEGGHQHPGGETQNGIIHIAPSSEDDSFFGELTVAIPSGHGDLYHNGQKLVPGEEYDGISLLDKDGNEVTGKLTVVEKDGKLTVSFTPDTPDASYKDLELELRLPSNDYSDKDISIDVTGNLQNDKSGQQASGVEGKGELLVDAGSRPTEDPGAEKGESDPLIPGGDTGIFVTLKGTFVDTEDGSESHYFLLEAKAGFSYTFTVGGKEYTIDPTTGYETVLGPDGKQYYKIPATPGSDGRASIDVEIKASNPYLGDKESTINYGTMSEDKTSGDGEKTYDNNITINVDNEIALEVDLRGDSPVTVDVGYENNTPDAHVGDFDEQYAKVNLPDDAAVIKLKPGDGAILVKEGDGYRELVPDEDGWVTVPKGQEGDIYYKVPENYSDKDLSLGYEITGGNSDGAKGSETVHVDTVAQQGKVDGTEVQTGEDAEGNGYTHVGDGPVTVTVTLSGFDDPDPDTSYYALIEAKPGWECLEENAELVLINGKAYYRVPIDSSDIHDGKVDVSIKMKAPNPESGGEIHEEFTVGGMVVDTPLDLGEFTTDNNISVNLDGKVIIDKSVVDTHLKLSVSAGHEDKLGDTALFSLSGVGEHDVLTELHFSVDSSEGEFIYNGQPLLPNGYSDANITITVTEEGGKTVVSIKPTPPSTGMTEQDLYDSLNGKFGLDPADGNSSNKDIEIEWGYGAKDTQSGHTQNVDSQKHDVVIDAVAHAPEVMEYSIDYGDGREAAEPGDSVTIKATVKFVSIEDEENYVLVQFTPGWAVDGVTLTVNGQQIHFTAEEISEMGLVYPNGTGSGGAYYKIPLEKDGVKLLPGVNEGEPYSVDVAVETHVPEKGITGDTQGKLGVGGMAQDSYADGETNLSNNIASDTKNTDADGNGINVGVVDTDGLKVGQVGDVPTEGSGESIDLDISLVGGNNDVIVGLKLTNPDPGSGDFYYDGVKLEYDGKSVVLPPASLTPEEQNAWRFDSSKLTFQPGDTFGGNIKIKVEATVEDEKSGAREDFEASLPIQVTPEATAPTDLEVISSFDPEGGGIWTVTLSASYADIDGSEKHFFLFKIPEGLVLEGTYPGLEPAFGPNGEEGYWKILVDSSVSAPEVDLTFRPETEWDGTGLDFHAGATENGQTAWGAAPTEIIEGFAGGFDGIITPLVDVLYDGGQDVFFWEISAVATGTPTHFRIENLDDGDRSLLLGDMFGDDMPDISLDDLLHFPVGDAGKFSESVESPAEKQSASASPDTCVGTSVAGQPLEMTISFPEVMESHFGDEADVVKNLISQGVV